VQKSQKLLTEMSHLLDLLIKNAEELLSEVHKMDIDEDKLRELQKIQDDWLTEYILKDDMWREYHLEILDQPSSILQSQVDQKLNQFQQLNIKFIDSIKNIC